MKMDVTDCELLSVDSGIVDCPITAQKVGVLFLTLRLTGQVLPVNLAIRNPHRLAADVPLVIAQSRVLSGDGKFVPEKVEGQQ